MDDLLADTGEDADDDFSLNPPASYSPPAADPDKWPSHPAGPAGSWLRARVEESWRVLSRDAGRNLFDPPVPSTSAKKKTEGVCARQKKAAEMTEGRASVHNPSIC